jgi:hypothetical protein
MRSVFDGGVGWVSGGIVERSSDSGVRDLEAGGDDFGELLAVIFEALKCSTQCIKSTGRVEEYEDPPRGNREEFVVFLSSKVVEV